MSETTETTWADLDLSAVVEQEAATVWDQQKPPEIAWDQVNEITRHNAREAVLPFVVATLRHLDDAAAALGGERA